MDGRYCVQIVIFCLTTGLATGLVFAQAPRVEVLEQLVVTPVHLVGHEDHELLADVQELIDDWDPRKLVNPTFVITSSPGQHGHPQVSGQLLRPDLAEFITDVEAAQVLGKAFFWDMQAGSDFRRVDDKRFVGTACASCHYRHGADPRGRHATRIPYVVWDQYKLHPQHNMEPFDFGEKRLPYDVTDAAVSPFAFDFTKYGKLSFINGSAGVEPYRFQGLDARYRWQKPFDLSKVPVGWESEKQVIRSPEGFDPPPEWAMFIAKPMPTEQAKGFRQITARNSPSVINSVFSDRLFHDGRAESTFNGYSIFGDRDHRPVLFRGTIVRDDTGRPVLDSDGNPKYGVPVQVDIAIPKAALASQAVGPIVNDVEMSYVGRTFPNVACKLLDARILAAQDIDDNDSVLGSWKRRGLIGKNGTLTYRDLIQRAFRREWWDGGTSPVRDDKGDLVLDERGKPIERDNVVPLVLLGSRDDERRARGSIMVANFSLYWGLSIMMYESSLVSNQSPFDAMMMGNPKLVNQRWEEMRAEIGTFPIDLQRHPDPNLYSEPPKHANGASVFQHGFRVFLRNDCVECHGGPLFSELYERHPEDPKFPINLLISHTLLPNSRADSLAQRVHAFHAQVLQEVATELASEAQISQDEAMRWARQLDLNREFARGFETDLMKAIKEQIKPLFPNPANAEPLAIKLAHKLMSFEKQYPEQLGERDFFTEDERIAVADFLAEPVLVESMPFNEKQAQQRRPLPIKGRLATDSYAFYDTAFYALGLTPPRYDRGVGGRIATELPTEEEIASTFEQFIQEEPSKAARAVVPELPDDVSLRKALLKRAVGERKAQGSTFEDREMEKSFQEFRTQIQKRVVRQQPNSGARGQAYRLPQQWKSIEQYTMPVEQPDKATTPLAPLPVRNGYDAPNYNPDEEQLEIPFIDTTWDRDDIPETVRRSDLSFFSRARTLVVDEEPWGYRKPFLHDNELAFWGAFKTPSLRNAELTAPYMHNGSLKSLGDVIDFYEQGGFIMMEREAYPDKHPEIRPLDFLTGDDQKALRFFLLCLTDERVRLEKAPFDHPSLNVVNGYESDSFTPRIQSVDSIGAQGWVLPDGHPDASRIPQSFPVN
ncbi:cytochrome c peroxidase [Blastopirellula marina]|uniref:cytochrome c peroxidase n=1 Tax=Blastopirellula marina TaxID=124 RepID=UPI0018EE2E86|nr:cytochrome c peroxidase [Blastopirellula marina]